MDTLSDQLNNLASQWATLSEWLFPTFWLLLGVFAFTNNHRLAGTGLALAGASSLLFSFLFAPGSSFTEGWQTDAPLNVYFSYKPIGYLAANLLPAISNFALVFALLALLRRRG